MPLNTTGTTMQCQNTSASIAATDDQSGMVLNRRQLIVSALLAGSCFPASSEAVSVRLDPADPSAKNVGYVEDAIKVDNRKYPTYAKGQTCANCSLVQQRYGPMRPCGLFPGRMVTAKGWCNAWSLRTFGK